jgi:hypothetical protein
LELPASKYHAWQQHYGRPNVHNGRLPRDGWLEAWEKQAILDFHARLPLEGYRRLAFMMLDADVVAVSPSSVYRVLKAAGRLDRHRWAPSKKGDGLCAGLTHVRTSPYYPQSNGKQERWYGTLKGERFRRAAPGTLEEARRVVSDFVKHYNEVRLHSALGYITPTDKLAGLEKVIAAERDRKLQQARQRRRAAA